MVPPECYGNLLQHFTGSKDHNIALREDAVRRGLSISEYGVTEVESGEVFRESRHFSARLNAGAVKAQQELNGNGCKLDIIWKGPLREDDREQQLQVVENFTTRRVSAIVLAPLDSQALVRPVHRAIQAKVPVVIMDSDLKSDEYVSFVATDNYKGGRLAGDEMGRLLGGKGNVILLRYAVGSASTEAREAGFLDALKASYPNVKVISSDQHAGAQKNEGQDGKGEKAGQARDGGKKETQNNGQAEVAFYPNGTCDGVTVVFAGSEKGQALAVTVDAVTARATVSAVKR